MRKSRLHHDSLIIHFSKLIKKNTKENVIEHHKSVPRFQHDEQITPLNFA
jgi:hypothetical protein